MSDFRLMLHTQRHNLPLFRSRAFLRRSTRIHYCESKLKLQVSQIPIIFVEQHGLNSGEAGMVFLSMAAGSTIGVCVYVF